MPVHLSLAAPGEGMDHQLRELRLQEERAFLQSVARTHGSPEQGEELEGDSDGEGEHRRSEDEGGRRKSRARPIVPEPVSSDGDLPLPQVPKSPRDTSLLAGAVERNDFLRRLGEGQTDAMVQSFTPAQHGPGDTVLAEGTEGHAMYIVAEGELSVTQRGRRLRTLLPGDVFGELALLYNCRRTATSAALTPVRLWALDRQRYRAIVTGSAKRRRAQILGSLREAQWLQGLSDAHLSKLLDAMEECTFGHDEVIIREGDEGKDFYIILRGEVRVSHSVGGREEPIRVMRAGEHFGELSLLRNIRRTATCRAQGEVTCITVAKEDFQEIGPLCPPPHSELSGAVAWACPGTRPVGAPCLRGPGRGPGAPGVGVETQPWGAMCPVPRGSRHGPQVDFGFAKELARGEKTYSFCGTPEYLAPEILRHEGHDFAVDFWMLGVLVFEMLVGRPPFHSAEPQKIYSKILDGVFSFPAYLSEAACSLIAKLCRRRPGQRLGDTGAGIRGIRKHRWFGAVKWKRLALRQLDAPTLALMKQGPPYANFKRFSVDWTPAEEEFSGWDEDF
ncbi:cGMP-dependent protein kinase egl-4-like [Alligator sinensis]|uniref:cGMP-dependent protein kinase egl-4-like n=1 Tax=Alligator sinensis TaxID=38654 RepID=A0A3Q0HHD7_ALLSI|nr:cGMP-dependent protein kinase egl-4-like [Alligator sinensis]